jgi:diacylglycerol kinase
MYKNHNLIGSFKYAFRGFRDALREEPNLQIHTAAAITACILGFLLKLNSIEWAILILTMSFVFLMELINTTLETIVDIVSPEIKEKARVAKDVSAAGVLFAALTSIIIGLLIFLPKLLNLIYS